MNELDCIEVRPGPFNKVLEVPASHAYTTRLLMISSLYPGPVKIENYSRSADVLNLLQCLRAMNLKIEEQEQALVVHNSFPLCELGDTKEVAPSRALDLWTGEGEITNHFLLGLLCKGKRKYRLHAEGQMIEWPMQRTYDFLRSVQVKVSTSGAPSFPVEIQGPLQFTYSRTEIDCQDGDYLLSALALAYCDSKIQLIPIHHQNILKEYQFTLNVIKIFYFELLKKNLIFPIPVDFSLLSYPVALALLDGKVVVKNCHFIDMMQPDSVLLKIIKLMGGDYKIDALGLTVSQAPMLKGLQWDCSNCPELVPVLCFLCAYAHGESRLTHLGTFAAKEGQLLQEVQKLLTSFKVPHKYEEINQTLILQGPAPKVTQPQMVNIPDHRMIMVSYLFMRHNQGGKIHQIHRVQKFFEKFFKIME